MIPITELRTLVGLDVGDASDDDLLLELEAFAVSQAELKSHFYLGESSEATDRIIGDGTPRLTLPRWPASAVASVTESWPYDDVLAETPIVGFRIGDDYQLLRTGSNVWADGYEYAVTYTAGYAVGSFPAVFVSVVKDIVAMKYPVDKASADPAAPDVTPKRETLGDYTIENFAPSSSELDVDSSLTSILARLPIRIRA